MDYEAFARSWDGHVRELINVTAKKAAAIDKKHKQIVDGACQVFFRKGYHPTSIREISEAAGMSMGQLYHYISSKDDVLFLIHRHMQTAWYKFLTERLVEDPDDPVKTLIDAMHLTMEFHTTNKKLLQFIYSESKYLSKNHLQVVLQMDDKNVVQFWRDRLAAIQQKRGLDLDINSTANIISYLNVFIPLRGWNLKDRPIREHQAMVTQFVLRALGLTPNRPSALREPVA
jgi:AcrR family transcriptional regulator